MITLIITAMAGGRKLDPKNPRQVAEMAKRDLRLAVPTVFASAIDVDGRPVVIACVGNESDSRAEHAFGNWYAQTSPDGVLEALERNNVAAVITSAGVPADPAEMFGGVLELHTPDASVNVHDSFGEVVANALQDQLRNVAVLASLSIGTVNNAHGDSILTVVSSTKEDKATEMTNSEMQLDFPVLLTAIHAAAAKIQSMTGTKPETHFADAQALGKLLNLARRVGAMGSDAVNAISSDLETFVALLAMPQQPQESEAVHATATVAQHESHAADRSEIEIPEVEEADDRPAAQFAGAVIDGEVEEVEEPEAVEEIGDEEGDDSVTGMPYIDYFLNSALQDEGEEADEVVLVDDDGVALSEEDQEAVLTAVRDTLSSLLSNFSEELEAEFNEEDINEAATATELAQMMYGALAIVLAELDEDSEQVINDILSECDDSLEEIFAAADQADDGQEVEEQADDEQEVEEQADDDYSEDVIDDSDAVSVADPLSLVSVEIRPRVILALSTDIDQSVYGKETVSALRAVQSSDGATSYNLAVGINSPGVRRDNPDGFFRTPLLELAKSLGKLPTGLIMLPRNIVDSTDPEQLIEAVSSVVGGSIEGLFDSRVFNTDRIDIDEDGSIALGFEEDDDEAAPTVNINDFATLTVSADQSVDDSGNNVIDLNVFITLRLIGLRFLSKKETLAARLCSLAERMAANGIEVVPAFVYSATQSLYGPEVEREEIAALHQAFESVSAESEVWNAVGVISSDAEYGDLSGTGVISGGELLRLDNDNITDDSEAFLSAKLMDVVNSDAVGALFTLGGNVAVVLLSAVQEADDDADTDEE